MACLRTGGDDRGPVMDRSFARLPGPSALGAPSALILGAWEIEAPAPVVAALQLGMDEAVDGLMADDLVSNIAREAPRHLLGRPALRETGEDSHAQGIVAPQPGSGPAPGIGLRLRIGGLVAHQIGRASCRERVCLHV